MFNISVIVNNYKNKYSKSYFNYNENSKKEMIYDETYHHNKKNKWNISLPDIKKCIAFFNMCLN